MTRLLAIDTATEVCAVGVLDADGRLVARAETVGRGHAEVLMAMIGDAMAAAKIGFDELDRIAVTVGPGSFTGVRVGIAAARGLALASRATAVGVSTLAVHAEDARGTVLGRPVLAVLAAGRGELYGALFSPEGAAMSAAIAAPPEHFAAMVTEDVVLAGSGADLVAAATPAPVVVAHRKAVPEMAVLVRLAVRAHDESAPVRPLYLRPPDAKPQTAAAVARR